MIKKLICLLLCLIMPICFIACNENTNSKEKDSKITYNTLFDTYPSVFVTENITRIAFYGYYGGGTKSEVPAENMAEIINWLDTFTVHKEVDDERDGVNTYYVEIEYSDGTIIKEGLDIVTIDGTAYYIEKDKEPDCFQSIKTQSELKN